MYPVGHAPCGVLFSTERGLMVEFTSKSGNVYEMPELDASMYEKQRSVDEALDMEKRFNSAWSFIKAALPDECIMEELGYTDKRKAGVPRMMSLYHRVKAAYWSEYNEEQLYDMREQYGALESFPRIIEAAAKAQQMMSGQGGRQAFRAVK